MAMFDLKDSERIDVADSTTPGDTFMKGEGLKGVNVKNCHAGVASSVCAPPPEKLSRWRKVSGWFLEDVVKAPVRIVVGIIVMILGGVVLHYFS